MATPAAAADDPAVVASPHWSAHLDALEEWTRRAEAVVRGKDDALPDVPAEPADPLPRAHALRARAVLERMQQLLELGVHRRLSLDRASAYQRG